ncbi:MAG: polysaccharide deacetylase family protein [Clostridia bacterium]|nr:polysaccharide deacetylase family protein [Clostridia bacterium]
MEINKIFYPSWTTKAITFTIDDGNIPMDKRFIDIVKPQGIKGTFNLCAPNLKEYTPEFYRELYDGFGISNHCKLHPFALTPDKAREVSNEPFDSKVADVTKNYRTDVSGVYRYYSPAGWRNIAETDSYCRLISECHNELEAVFGEGSVSTFVWPYGEQADERILEYIESVCGYTAVRKTGALGSSTAFAVPTDMMHWSYNATHKDLLKAAKEYEDFADDGELKFFCFGLHSIDYERANCWNVLEEFAEKYGNREREFWYASVEDIFGYRDAVNELKITENTVENPTDTDVFAEINGKKTVIPKKTVIEL